MGDSCTDIYYYCKEPKINPEADAPLVNVIRTEKKQGMAENVVACLNNLGIQTIKIISDKPCVKSRYISSATGKQYLRVDNDIPTTPFTANFTTEYMLDKMNFDVDAVVISDYNKGFISESALVNILRKVTKIPVFIDTKKQDLSNLDNKCILKINEAEYRTATNIPRNVIVTFGEQGAVHKNRDYPALKCEVIDVCGAGDAFLAGMVYNYHLGDEAMIVAGIVNAGLSVEHQGTYAPTETELRNGLGRYARQSRNS